MTRVTEFPGPRTRRVGLRAAALAGVTVAAAAAVSGCGTGQVNQTGYMTPAVAGVNQTFPVSAPANESIGSNSGGSISVRNLLVSYSPQGYKKGGDAPLQVGIFNDTTATLKVTITAPSAAQSVTFKAGAPTQPITPLPSPSSTEAPSLSPSPVKPGISASAAATASAKASAAATPSQQPTPPSGPASFTIPAGQFLVLAPQFGKFLVLQGLTNDIKPGQTVDGVGFQFQLDGGLQVVPEPASPAPSASPAVVASCTFSGSTAVCRTPLGTPQSPQPREVPSVATHE